jgi:hypothetical protein
MATLIQSKQIQGVVTASVIEGDFSVSGSLVVTGSQTILGSVTASSISSSFIGDGSGLTGISYSQVLSTPQFVGGNNITITSSSNVITIDASLNGSVSSSTQITDGSGILSSSNETFPQFSSSADVRLINLETYSSSLDSRFLNTDGDNVVSASSQITISDTIGYTAFSSSLDLRIDVEKSRVDAILDSVDADKDSFAEIVTLINQVDTTNDVAFAAHYTSSRQRDTSLELFSSSIQSEVDSLTSATSSYLTEIPQGTISGSEQLPSGLVSSSNQVLGGTGILSGSYTDITDLNTFTQSVDTRVTSLESFSSSLDNTFATDAELTSLSSSISSSVSSNKSDINSLGNTNNAQNTRLDNLELFTSSLDSTYATDSELSLLSSSIDSKIESLSHSDNTELNAFTSSIQSEVDALIAATASYLTSETDSQTLTVSGDQLTISSGNTVTIPTGSNTDISHLNTFTSSIQSEVDALSSASSSYLTELPSGLVSGSVVEELPSGVISGSTQITITESQISDLTHYTDSDVKAKLDTEGVLSGSIVSQLPSGTISGSSQVTLSDADGFTSFSSSIDTSISTEKARIDAILLSSDADKDSFAEIVTLINQVDTDNDNAFAAHYTASNARIDSLEGFSSSIDTTIKTKLDTEGIVSGSTQVLGGSGIVSSSTQIESLLPEGTISGSTQVVSHLPSGTISGSTQVLGDSGILSSSVNFETYSSSIDSRVDTLETTFSSSVSDNLIILNDLSASHVVESSSLDDRLDRLEGGAALYYDLSNTVWNNKYIKGGLSLASNDDTTYDISFVFQLNASNKLTYDIDDVVYITNFDRDTVIHAQVSSSFDSVTRKVGFSVLDVNGITGSVKINDPYWIITKQSSGYVQLNDYISDSASIDSRLDEIEGPISSSFDLRILESYATASDHEGRIDILESTFATDAGLQSLSSSIDTRIDNVYLSQSIALSGVVSGSSQIDFREITNYVSDEHIDHTTVNVIAGDGLDGGGDIASSHEIRLNVTSSHFTSGVGNVLTSEGVVKQSTLDTDIIGTDFSQSVDTRIRSFAASSVPTGTVSGSTQVNITQTQNYTEFSSSIATSIAGVSGGASTDISHLNTFSSSIQSTVDSLVDVTASYATTGSNTFIGDQSILGSLIPGVGGIHNLGSADNPYGELFLTTGSVYLGNNKLSIDSDNDFKIESDGSLANLIANHIYFGNDKKKLSLNSDNKLQFTDNSNSVNYGFDLGANSLSDLIDVSSTSPTDGQSLVWDADNSTWIPSTVVAGSEIPQGTISSSQQISDLGFVTSSGAEGEHTDISHLNTFTSSVQTEVDGLSAQTSSYLTELPSGLVSSSDQVLGGTGILSGSHTDITLLNTFSGSIQSQVDTLIASTASYLTSETDNQTLTIVGDQLTISDGNTITIPTGSNVTLPSGIVSGSSQLTSSYDTRYLTSSSYFVDSASFDTRIDGIAAGNVPSGTVSSSAQITYDGNRIISNDKLGDLFTDSVNPGTSGSVIDFLNAIFYPNTGPSISTGNQTIIEYVTSGTTITTVSGTDPEGQSITFGTSSLYTDDLVRVASNGVMTLNALAESSSFNTDLVGGVRGHKVEVTATDSFGTTTEKDIYVIVTPNSTPVFRETSTSGNVITSVTANLNESSTDDTLVKRIYFTDSNGDNITIYSSSIDNNHFDVTKYSTYVDIRQNTSSLDYEQQTSYTFSISASDEHYEAGQDSDSIVGLPITINVTDNLTPTVNNQTLSSINENSSNGATVGSISAADNEGNTITFVNFELHQLQLDGSIVSSGSYSGTSQLTDPHENPFQMSTSGIVTRKTGVYLNSDLVNRYVYRAQVTDPYNGTSDVALITINIDDDTPATLSDNWSAGPYIKESELSSTTIKTTDYGSTTADYGSNQSGTWSSSNSAISINSNGTLSLGVNLSGSVTQSGDTIDSTITFTNTFGTTTTDSLTLDVVGNDAPTATFTNQTSVFDSNQATSGTNLVSVSISDTESDSPYQLSIGGTDASKLNAVPQNVASSSWQLQASEDLIGGTYTYDVTITDTYSETTTYSSRTITIAQGDTGTLGGDTTSYIIESAESGDVLRDVTGYNQGNASQLSVSYTDYGSPSVQSYTSSNEAFNIDTSGNITLGLDLSGSVTQSGDTINSDITFVDQYGNIGSGSLSVTVFANNPASATFSENSSFFNTNQATGSTSLVDITGISDTESNTPYVVTLSGTDASSFSVVSQNANGTVWELQPSSDLSAGDYDYNVVITDNYSEVTTYSRSLTISQADNGTLGGDTTSYIIESGENGDAFRDASGFGAGNTSQLSVSYSPNYGSSVVQSFTSSNDSVTINGSGYITFNGNLSGTGSGDTITSDITFDDQYGNVGSGSVTVNVFANGAPTADFSNSGLTGNYNENLATSGTVLLTSTITDTEGDTPYSMSLSGTGAWAIEAVPQNSDSSSYEIQVTYDTSSLVAGTYTYDVEVTDSFGKSTTYSNRTFTIAAADDGTLVSTDTYIIESAVSGDSIRRNSDGRSGTQSSVAVSYSPSYGSPVATNFASSNALIDIDSNGRLSVGNDISGSSSTNGSIIATTITWNDQYSNNGSQVISIDVTKNFAPTVLSTQTFNENTNEARGTSEIVRLNLTDAESNTINSSGLSWTNYNTTYFTPSNTTGQMKLLVNSTNIPAGEYDYTASIEDVHGFDTTLHSGSVEILQADNGTLGGDTSIYSIESAESGDAFRDATGYNNGNAAQVSVSYSPTYGSPSVQTFSSSNPAIAIDNSGNLTLGVDISGSVTQSGDTITSTITFTDEYGNSNTDTVTATIFGNQSPAAGFTSSSNYESDNATSGSDAGSLVVTDVESNSPFTISLGGTDGGKFDVSGTSSPFEIQPTETLSAGTYSIDITVTDTYSETVTLTNETIVVDASEVLTEGYIYYSAFGSDAGFAANYLGLMGASTVNSDVPPQVTAYTANTLSPFNKFKTGDIGSTSITYAGGSTATLGGTISGSNFNDAIKSAGNMSWGTGVQTIFVIPSGSTMTGIPTSMTDGTGGSTAGEYVLVEYADGVGAPLGATPSIIHSIVLDSAKDGYTEWFVIGAKQQNSASNMRLQIIPSSGSISDFA